MLDDWVPLAVDPDTERVCAVAKRRGDLAACRAAFAVTRGASWTMVARRYGYPTADAARDAGVRHVEHELAQ